MKINQINQNCPVDLGAFQEVIDHSGKDSGTDPNILPDSNDESES